MPARKTRTRRRNALPLLALALAAGACGGGGEEEEAPPPRPALAAPVAERLAAKSDEIANALDAGDVCTAAVRADELQAETLNAINAGQVPPAFQEDLSARVNELVNEVNCPPPVVTTNEDDEDKGKGKGKGKGKNKNDDDLVPVPTDVVPTEPDE